MNYLRAYCNLIRKAENRVPPEGYVERHHVFPKSLYGENKRIVKLTAREHYIAHALLEKALIKRYGNKDIRSIKMTYAFSFMNNHTNQNNYCNSHLYEGCRMRYIDFLSNRPKEEHPMYGKNHTAESKAKISKNQKGKVISEATRLKLRGKSSWSKGLPYELNPLSGIPRTEEVKKKISEANKGKKVSEEQREYLRKLYTGKQLSEEHKQNIGNALRGKKYKKRVSRGPCDEETKKKIGEANKGSKRTEEQKEKMRQSALRRWNKDK